jgi:hypothetical protein
MGRAGTRGCTHPGASPARPQPDSRDLGPVDGTDLAALRVGGWAEVAGHGGSCAMSCVQDQPASRKGRWLSGGWRGAADASGRVGIS